MSKKIYTREEFEQLRMSESEKMVNDTVLYNDALDILVRADKYHWIHQTNWMGEPILQLPQDLFTIQEIVYETRPDYIIELGVAWGGSLLYYSSLMEMFGGKKVIGVDIFIPDDLKKRIYKHKLSKRIELIKGSSVEDNTINKIKKIITNNKKCLIILDSYHTHEHVLKELNLYSNFIGKGYYIIVCDTYIENSPKLYRDREWGYNNNPYTAVQQFLKENKKFIIDRKKSNKLLITCNPGGYLKCIK